MTQRNILVGTGFASWAVALMLLSPLAALADEGDFSADIDATVGLEALEEPNKSNELETETYLAVSVAALLRAWNLQAYFQGPLRFNLDGFAIRDKDWDETEEILRAVRCFRIDYMSADGSEIQYREDGGCNSWTPEEAVGDVAAERSNFLYLSTRLRPIREYSLGYSSIVSGYNAMLEEDHYREGIALEANINRHFTINAALSDIIDPTATMGRVAFRPLQNQVEGYDPDYSDESADTDIFVEVGVTAASDLAPPTELNVETGKFDTDSAVLVGGVDARIRYSSADTWTHESYRVLRFEYGAEFNKIFEHGEAMHNHLRFYYDVGSVDFFIDGEYRLLFGRYLPVYFDPHYRVQRGQYFLSDDQRDLVGTEELTLTKLDFLRSLPEQTEHAYAGTMRFRFWKQVEDGFSRSVDTWLFAEGVPGRDLSNRAGFGLKLYSLFDKLTIQGLFVQQGWDDFGGLLTLQNSVLEVDARYLLTEELYLDFFFDQTWFLVEGGGFDTANDIGLNLGYVPDF